MEKKYRFAFDLGTNSIGFAVFEVDPTDKEKIQDFVTCGSRIFSDSRDDKTKASLAVARREARQQRRRSDRIVRRRRLLLSHLVEYGLFPSDKKEQEAMKVLDPYFLRDKLLQEKCTLFELGRAILHLNRRRGFKSSRKDDRAKGGKLAQGIKHLQEALQGRTLGQYYNDIKQGRSHLRSIKCRPSDTDQDRYDFYIDRHMVEEEFRAIWDFQQNFYPSILTEERYEQLHRDIFYQRPLLPQEIGKCRFEKGESRAPTTLPTFELYRLYLELAHLRISTENYTQRSLTPAERDILIEECCTKKSISFTSLRKLLNLDSNFVFTHSSLKKDEKNDKLECCPTMSDIYKICKGSRYNELSLKDKDTLAYLIMDCSDRDILISLLTKEIQLSDDIELQEDIDEESQKVLNSFSLFNKKYQKNKTSLSIRNINALPQFTYEEAQALSELQIKDSSYAKLSLKAIRKILPYLQEPKDVIENGIYLNRYNDACLLAGYVHSDTTTSKIKRSEIDPITGEEVESTELHKRLPYYACVLPESVMGEWKGEQSGSEWSQLNNRERYGFISNPTVHVALNQIRIVVNALIKEYGHPTSIVVELARDIAMGATEKGKYIRKQSENTLENRILKEIIKERGGNPDSRNDIIKMRLFREAERAGISPVCCIYSGKTISLGQLFSREIEVDHIINHADSNDDSIDNKILCFSKENQYKGNRTPYEAFHMDKEKWESISNRAKDLPKRKRWRFQQDARQQFEEKHERHARDIGDTRYIARIATKYLQAICDDIFVVTGSHTNFLAKQWGFLDLLQEENYTPTAFTTVMSEIKKEGKQKSQVRSESESYETVRGELLQKSIAQEVYNSANEKIEKKNRLNHFHHAIDACLIGCMTAPMRQYFATVGKKAEELTKELVEEYKEKNSELTPKQQESIRFVIRNNIRDFSKEEYILALPSEVHMRIKEQQDSLHRRFAPPIPNLLDRIKDVLSHQVVSHKVDHNTLGQLHKETNYGRVEHSLRFQDMTMEDLRLIKYRPLLEHIVLELGYAYGIPCDIRDVVKVCDKIEGATEKGAEKELSKFLSIDKDLLLSERAKKFIVAFTKICKEEKAQELLRTAWKLYGNEKYATREVMRKIPCRYDENRFIGSVVSRIAVKDMRIEDLPYIREKELLARILQRLVGYTVEEAMSYAKELHKKTAREKKTRIQEILNHMSEKQFKEEFTNICKAINIRRIQCVDNKNDLIWIQDAQGKEYKGVDGRNNAYMTIYIDSSGKWCGECISAYDANQKDFIPEWKKNPDNIYVTDIYKGDAIEIDTGEDDRGNKRREVFIVQKMDSGHGIYLAHHRESNVATREKELREKNLYKQTAISSLQKLKPCFVYIDPLGRVIYKSGIVYSRDTK